MAHINIGGNNKVTGEGPGLVCFGADNVESLGLIIVFGETARTDAKMIGAEGESVGRGGRIKVDTLNGAGGPEHDSILTVGSIGVEDGVIAGAGRRASDPVAPGGPSAGFRTTTPNHL